MDVVDCYFLGGGFGWHKILFRIHWCQTIPERRYLAFRHVENLREKHMKLSFFSTDSFTQNCDALLMHLSLLFLLWCNKLENPLPIIKTGSLVTVGSPLYVFPQYVYC